MKNKRDLFSSGKRMNTNRRKVKTQVDSDTATQQVNEEIEQIEKEIFNKRYLPDKEETKINNKVFENVFIADIIMLFLYLISLGSLNIETPVFLMDLKVFSIGLVILTIILFEIGYKKENGNIAIHRNRSFCIINICIIFRIYIYNAYKKIPYICSNVFIYDVNLLCG